MDESPDQIEKPWAVYFGTPGLGGIGRIPEYEGIYPRIQPHEGSSIITYWYPEWVKTFKTVNEAIDYFIIHQQPYEEEYSRETTLKQVSRHFPSAMKQEKQKELHSLVDILKQVALSQSLTKCTQPKPASCGYCVRKEKSMLKS